MEFSFLFSASEQVMLFSFRLEKWFESEFECYVGY
jgi:hypothetical protein